MTVDKKTESKPEFDYDGFIEKASSYRYHLQKEKEIKAKRHQLISALGAAAVNLVGMLTENNGGSGGPESTIPPAQLLTADLGNGVIYLRAGRRRLTLTVLSGVGNDRDLTNPRNENCGHILAYAFMSDQDTAMLVSRIRIYNNGDATDGELSWNIKDGAEGCYPYLSDLIERCLFNLDMAWIKSEDLPAYLDKVPIVSSEIHLEHLRRTSGQYSIKPSEKKAK